MPGQPRVARRLGHLGGPGPYEIDGRNRKRPPGKRLEGRGLREDRHANRNEVKKAWEESWPKPYEDRKSATFIHHGPMAGGHERRPASRASIKIGEEASRGKITPFIHHGPMAGGHERRPASRASIKIGEEASRGKITPFSRGPPPGKIRDAAFQRQRAFLPLPESAFIGQSVPGSFWPSLAGELWFTWIDPLSSAPAFPG